MTFEIVPARVAADFAEARVLFAAYAAESDSDRCFQGFPRELAELETRYQPPQGVLLLVRDGDGTAHGCIALRRDGAAATLRRLYVRPTARRVGLGRRLTEAALAEARRLGASRVNLETRDTMHAAHALYAALGFAEVPGSSPGASTRYLTRRLG